ncbi:MAG: HEAT repeat domain-containing protein [Planctomycetota bacterium]|nr:HEAT repeat domain-containing protein [Planctomycetota bacterium]
MSSQSAKTFNFLASTRNPHVAEALIDALDVPYPTLQAQAVRAITSRDGLTVQVAVVARWLRLCPIAKQHAAQRLTRLEIGLKQCLQHGIEAHALAAIEMVRDTRSMNAIPLLIDAYCREEPTVGSQAVQCIQELVNHLYVQLHPDQLAISLPIPEIAGVRHSVVQALGTALTDGRSLPDPMRIAECYVMLAEPNADSTRKKFNDPNAEAAIVDLLLNSTAPGVIRFLLEALANNFPPQQVMRTLEFRSDKTFVQAVLTWFRDKHDQIHADNLKRLTSIAWLEKFRQIQELVPPHLQGSLVAFTEATGLTEFRKTSILKWLLQNGSPEGRSAAAQSIAKLDTTATLSIVQDGLDSQDESVQAWATSQLRSQKIPDAMAQLTKRLDSPLAAVREVARHELSGFDIERLLSLFKQLDPEVCLRAGETIQKINPQCIRDLVEEMTSPMRQKRIRAAEGALALGMHQQVVPQLLAMVCDSDAHVRRTAAVVLGHAPTDETIEVLKILCDDASPRVREAAVRSITMLEETSMGLVHA